MLLVSVNPRQRLEGPDGSRILEGRTVSVNSYVDGIVSVTVVPWASTEVIAMRPRSFLALARMF